MAKKLWNKSYEEYEKDLEFMKNIDWHCDWRYEVEEHLKEQKIENRFDILDL